MKQIFLGTAFVLPVILIIGAIKYFQVTAAIAEHANFSPPPEAITTAKVAAQDWQRTYSAVGSVVPIDGAMLAADEIGRVSKINFDSGQDVQAGQVLVELDTTVEQANLKEAQARYDRAKKKADRYEQLKNTKAVSPDVIDDTWMELRQATSAVDSLTSIIRRKNIIAPFSGRVGIRQVNVGQVVLPGTAIVALHALDKLYVNFSLPQQALPEISAGAAVNIKVDAYSGTEFHGKINAIDPHISESTRNVTLQAVVENLDKRLRPGMFASVELLLPEIRHVLAIPATSINYAPYGDSVYVVSKMNDPKGQEYLGVQQKMIQLGEHRGDFVEVRSGLSESEEIASAGVFKLRQGAAVLVNNDIKPNESLTPNPADT